MKHFRLAMAAIIFCCFGVVNAQTPTYGVTNFNDPTYDQSVFFSGSAAPSVLQANNVAGTGWNFYVGALGNYAITQINSGTSSYDGGITATNLTQGAPSIYQSFGFSTIPNSNGAYPKFKLNSFRVKITNSHPTNPQGLSIAGIVGTNAGGVQPLMVMPGTAWYTVNTSSNPFFYNINAVLVINGNGVDPQTASQFITEIVIDDIDITAPQATGALPTFTQHPANKTTCVGGSTSFTVAAQNASGYSWFTSPDGVIWTPIISSNAGTTYSGYNTATLTVSNAKLSQNNLYLFANATNANGNQASNVARLYVTTMNAGTVSGPSTLCVGQTGSYTSTVAGGTWSGATVHLALNSAGVATAQTAGTSSVIYTVTAAGGCKATASQVVTVNPSPAMPSIAYGSGNTVNPQAGAPAGSFCRNRTFNIVGYPSGGTFNGTGSVTVNNAGNVVISNATGPSSISYSVNSGAGCPATRTISFDVVACATKGISNNQQSVIDSRHADIYPNPAHGMVNVKISQPVNGTISVTDLFGKQIKKQPISLGTNTIDVSNLAKGMYTISIITKEGTDTQKLIVE